MFQALVCNNNRLRCRHNYKLQSLTSHPLHLELRVSKGTGLKCGSPWLSETEQTSSRLINLRDIKTGNECAAIAVKDRYLTKVIIRLSRDCRSLANVATETIISITPQTKRKMPEGPELHLAMLSINKICKDILFGGKILKNPVHKCPDIQWCSPAYKISADSRGKELLLHLVPVADGLPQKKMQKTVQQSATTILFTFGMSGMFAFTPVQDLPKHAHLSFLTKDIPKMALSFVDVRRFGKWSEGSHWSTERGPCVIQEYPSFLTNILANLENPVFNRPICEAMLDQKFFSGIGNYLRAEILFRCKIPPFVAAKSVFQTAKKQDGESRVKETSKYFSSHSKDHKKKSRKACVKPDLPETETDNIENGSLAENKLTFEELPPKAQELLRLCHEVPLEVIHLGSSKYGVSDIELGKDHDDFEKWLQCYSQEGMNNLADHNKRTIWFSGPAGPMAPKEQKIRRVQTYKKVKSSDSNDEKAGITENLACVSTVKTENILPVDTLKSSAEGKCTNNLLADPIKAESADINMDVSHTAKVNINIKSVQSTKRSRNKSEIKAVRSSKVKVVDSEETVIVSRATRSSKRRT